MKKHSNLAGYADSDALEVGIGSRIRETRKTLGMRQGTLAETIKVRQSSLSEIESGETKQPGADTLLAIANALEVNPHWLQTGKGSPTAPIDATPDTSEVIALFATLNPVNLASWLAAGRAMLAAQTTKPSRAQPYSAVKARSK